MARGHLSANYGKSILVTLIQYLVLIPLKYTFLCLVCIVVYTFVVCD